MVVFQLQLHVCMWYIIVRPFMTSPYRKRHVCICVQLLLLCSKTYSMEAVLQRVGRGHFLFVPGAGSIRHLSHHGKCPPLTKLAHSSLCNSKHILSFLSSCLVSTLCCSRVRLYAGCRYEAHIVFFVYQCSAFSPDV